jgi:hypothetical protein
MGTRHSNPQNPPEPAKEGYGVLPEQGGRNATGLFRTILVCGFNRTGKSTLCNGLANAPFATAAPVNDNGANTVINTEFYTNWNGQTFRILDTPDVAHWENIVNVFSKDLAWKKWAGSNKMRYTLCSIFFTTNGQNIGHFIWIAKLVLRIDPDVKLTILFLPAVGRDNDRDIAHTSDKIHDALKRHLGDDCNITVLQNSVLAKRQETDLPGAPDRYCASFIKRLWSECVHTPAIAKVYQESLLAKIRNWPKPVELNALGAGEQYFNIEGWTKFAEKPRITNALQADQNRPFNFQNCEVYFEEVLFITKVRRLDN